MSLGLLEQVEGGTLRLHRLLVAFTRTIVEDEDAQAVVEEVLAETASKLNREGFPSALLPLQPHLRYVEGAATARSSPYAALLAINLGYYLHASGDFAAARPYLERALAIYEKVLGPDHPDTATSLNNLGLQLTTGAGIAAARPALVRGLFTCQVQEVLKRAARQASVYPRGSVAAAGNHGLTVRAKGRADHLSCVPA